MSMTTIGIILVLVIGAAIGLYYYRKKSVLKLFEEVYMNAHQIPKKQKNSFLLLMFKESMSKPKDKTKKPGDNLKNQKYVQIQMIQMSKVLKDTSKVTDKATKKALTLLNDYQKWEQEKINKAKDAK